MRYLPMTVRCRRCGELVHAQVDLFNDLSLADAAEGTGDDYVCRKGLVGNGRCYQTIEVQLHFDKNRRLTDKTVTGGEWVENTD